MAWFLNFYKCERCKQRWTDEWSCTCDDTCPNCGARDMSPVDSHNLTNIVEQDRNEFIAIRPQNTILTITNSVAFRHTKPRWGF